MLRCIGVVALLIALTAATTSAAETPMFEPTFALGGGIRPAGLPSVAVSGNVAVAVFMEGLSTSEARVLRRFSTDGGRSWSTAAPLYADPARFPGVAIVGSAIHAVFEVEDPMDPGEAIVAYTKSDDGGATFSPPVRIGKAGGWRFDAHLAGPQVGGHGEALWITWLDEAGHLQLYRKVGAAPHTFTEIEKSAKTFLYRLANDGNNVYVLSQADDAGIAMVFYKSTDAGLTFAPGRVLGQPRSRAYEGMALSAYGFRVVVAWRPPRSKALQVRLSTDRGQTFGRPLLFKASRNESVALSASLRRIELLRVIPVDGPVQTNRLLLYVLPKRATQFEKPIVVRQAKQIGLGFLAPPVITADEFQSLYAWTEPGTGGRARAFVRHGSYPQ